MNRAFLSLVCRRRATFATLPPLNNPIHSRDIGGRIFMRRDPAEIGENVGFGAPDQFEFGFEQHMEKADVVA